MGFAFATARDMAEALALDTGRVRGESPALRGRPRMAIAVGARMAIELGARMAIAASARMAGARRMAFAMAAELQA